MLQIHEVETRNLALAGLAKLLAVRGLMSRPSQISPVSISGDTSALIIIGSRRRAVAKIAGEFARGAGVPVFTADPKDVRRALVSSSSPASVTKTQIVANPVAAQSTGAIPEKVIFKHWEGAHLHAAIAAIAALARLHQEDAHDIECIPALTPTWACDPSKRMDYIAQRYIRGLTSLDDQVAGSLCSFADALRHIKNAMFGCAALYERGLTMLDIDLSNIFVALGKNGESSQTLMVDQDHMYIRGHRLWFFPGKRIRSKTTGGSNCDRSMFDTYIQQHFPFEPTDRHIALQFGVTIRQLLGYVDGEPMSQYVLVPLAKFAERFASIGMLTGRRNITLRDMAEEFARNFADNKAFLDNHSRVQFRETMQPYNRPEP